MAPQRRAGVDTSSSGLVQAEVICRRISLARNEHEAGSKQILMKIYSLLILRPRTLTRRSSGMSVDTQRTTQCYIADVTVHICYIDLVWQ
jgi:hypothetical protein